MESLAHGIGVTNRFELFYNEDVDPLEILRQQEEEKQKRKVEKTQIKDKKPLKTAKQVISTASPKKPLESVPPKTQKSSDQVEVPNKQKGRSNDRPPRSIGNYQESKEVEKNARNKDENFYNPDQRERDGEFRRGRGGGGFRGARGGRGRGYFNNAEGRPRRVFDRHSGSDKSGVRPVDKRDGAGPNNWGDIKSDANLRKEVGWEEDGGGDAPQDNSTWEVDDSPKFGESEETPKGGDDSAPETTETKDTDQITEEQMQEAVKEMTLDEYKREQEAKRFVPKFNLRKPGEGEDDKQWKKGYVLKKKPKEEDDQDDDEEEEDEEFARKGKQNVLLDIQFNFSDSRRGTRGRGRGGRGGPRGAPGRDNAGGRDPPREDRVRDNRGGARGPAKPKAGQQAPRVDDFNDFPSLVNA